MNEYPSNLPRHARSFTVFINNDAGERMLTSTWIGDALFWKFKEDFLPRLARAGQLEFIARTERAFDPRDLEHGMTWFWKNKEWHLVFKGRRALILTERRRMAITKKRLFELLRDVPDETQLIMYNHSSEWYGSAPITEEAIAILDGYVVISYDGYFAEEYGNSPQDAINRLPQRGE